MGSSGAGTTIEIWVQIVNHAQLGHENLELTKAVLRRGFPLNRELHVTLAGVE